LTDITAKEVSICGHFVLPLRTKYLVISSLCMALGMFAVIKLQHRVQHTLQCGTCAMKPHDQGGVVDERLNVYGIKNLKVAGNIYIFEPLPYY